jgi:hypothetical protein
VKNNVFVFFLPGVRDYVLGTILGTYTIFLRFLFTFSFYVFFLRFLFTFSFYVFFFSWYVYVLGTYLNVISFVYTLFGRKRPKDKSYEKKLKSEHKSTLKAAN